MKKAILLLVFFVSILSFAQDEKTIDSLKTIISSKIPIEDKLEAYDDIFNIYLYSNPDLAKKYMNTLYKLNKEGKCEKCKCYADLENGNFYNSQMDFKKAVYYYDICAKKSLELKDYELLYSCNR